MLRIALDGDDVNGLRLVSVNVDWESEVGRKVPADLFPGLAGIVGAHHVPVLLVERHPRAGPVHRDAVNAVAAFGCRIGDMSGPQSLIERPPRLGAVVGSEGTR